MLNNSALAIQAFPAQGDADQLSLKKKKICSAIFGFNHFLVQELKSSHREVMVDMIMDVLRVLSSPNMDIRRKTLDIALDLITPRNIDEVVLTLKKEVVKTQNKELEKVGEYRQMLVQVGGADVDFEQLLCRSSKGCVDQLLIQGWTIS